MISKRASENEDGRERVARVRRLPALTVFSDVARGSKSCRPAPYRAQGNRNAPTFPDENFLTTARWLVLS
jgi:hypothetical protein